MAWLSSRLGLTTRRPKPMEFNRNPESAKTLRAHIPLLVGLVAPRHPPWNMAAARPGVIYFLLTSTHVKMVGRFNARDPLAGIVATWVFKLCCPRVKHLANFCLMLYRCSNFALMAPVPVCKKTWAGSNGFWLVRRKSCKVPPTQHRPRRLKRPQKVLPPLNFHQHVRLHACWFMRGYHGPSRVTKPTQRVA